MTTLFIPTRTTEKCPNVTYIDPSRYGEVLKITGDWGKTAQEALVKCLRSKEDAQCKQWISRWDATIAIDEIFKHYLTRPNRDEYLYAYQPDPHAPPQGLLLIKTSVQCPRAKDPEEKECISIQALAAQPPSASSHIPRIGTDLMDHAHYLAHRLHKKGIVARPLPSATGFYKKYQQTH